MSTKIIHQVINDFDPLEKRYTVLVIANVLESIQNEDDFILHTNFSEFFTRAEFATIISAITEIFGYVRIFYSEIEFINFVLQNKKQIDPNLTIVYNFARDGFHEGKKSLIPAFCDLFNLKYTGSNPFVISLLRNKFVFTKYLENMGILVPFSVKYEKYKKLDIKFPKYLKNLIAKNICEAASVGMSNGNIINLFSTNDLDSKLKSLCDTMNTNELLLQEYIDGVECEVFLIKYKNNYIAFPPIALTLHNSTIITDSISELYDYTFYPLSDNFSEEVCNKVCKTTELAASFLNIDNYARFDYRVDSNGNAYLIDIAGTPYLIRHSSVAYLFTNILNLNYTDIFRMLAALVFQ